MRDVMKEHLKRRARQAVCVLVGVLALGAADSEAAAQVAAHPAAVDKTLCVFDPGGKNGDLYAKIQTYSVNAAAWGVNFSLKAYTDESVAASDFRNRVCDAVVLTGLTGREFNPRTYTVEAMGLFDDYAGLERVIGLLAHPKAKPLNRSGIFETVGIYPAGAVYLYLRDRENASLAKLPGRSIAWIGADPAARQMIARVGATAKQADVSTFASMFKTGSVDACYSPATAYQPLELWRGLGTKGGVVRFPLAQLTFQVFIRSDDFPAEFGQRSREFVSQQFSLMMELVRKAEDTVKSWIEISRDDYSKYSAMLADVRSALIAAKVYDRSIVILAGKK